jgi:hypothetical protein
MRFPWMHHHTTSEPTNGGATVSNPTSSTPEPLLSLARIWGPVHSLAAAGITAAVMLGALSSKSGGMLNKGLTAGDIMMTAVTSVLAGAAPVLAANTVAVQGRAVVSPIPELVDNVLALPGGIVSGVGSLLGGLLGRKS